MSLLTVISTTLRVKFSLRPSSPKRKLPVSPSRSDCCWEKVIQVNNVTYSTVSYMYTTDWAAKYSLSTYFTSKFGDPVALLPDGVARTVESPGCIAQRFALIALQIRAECIRLLLQHPVERVGHKSDGIVNQCRLCLREIEKWPHHKSRC